MCVVGMFDTRRLTLPAPPATGEPSTNGAPPTTGAPSINGAPPREAPPTRADPGLETWPVLAGEPGARPHRRFYIPLRLKLAIVWAITLGWVVFSIWIAIPWIETLGRSITIPGAIAVIGGIAIIPGYLNAHLVASLLFDRPPPLRFDLDFPDLTVVVACFNEESTVGETITYALRSEYPGKLRVLIADDGSADATAEMAMREAVKDPRVSICRLGHNGKARSLTAALQAVPTPLVATVDADTLLMPGALTRIVSRLLVSPPTTVAAAGAVFVRNSRDNFLTKAQEWDYFLGIASIKRQQGLLQGTLVAQGAFSVYRTEALRRAGGWPDRIGEDIVLTWKMMEQGGGVTYERTAIAFTGAPSTLRAFAKQRRRWARGMIEGLREYGPSLIRGRRAFSHGVIVDYVFPYIDLVYSIAFPVGILLALTGNFAIVGPLTLLVLPLNALLSGFMYRLSKQSFTEVGLRVRRNPLGFFAYLLCYQLIMSPVSVAGYFQELFRAKRRW
jgi:biofilm PGA synthesis N-glycosyltransferase PgaC